MAGSAHRHPRNRIMEGHWGAAKDSRFSSRGLFSEESVSFNNYVNNKSYSSYCMQGGVSNRIQNFDGNLQEGS
jgi:hypothetical protein